MFKRYMIGVAYLMTVSAARLCGIEWKDDRGIMYWKGNSHILRYYHSICREALRKAYLHSKWISYLRTYDFA